MKYLVVVLLLLGTTAVEAALTCPQRVVRLMEGHTRRAELDALTTLTATVLPWEEWHLEEDPIALAPVSSLPLTARTPALPPLESRRLLGSSGTGINGARRLVRAVRALKAPAGHRRAALALQIRILLLPGKARAIGFSATLNRGDEKWLF